METRPIIILAALVLVAFAATLLLRQTGKLEAFELKAYDSYLGFLGDQSGPNDPIVMIEYTESDEAAYGFPLPMPFSASFSPSWSLTNRSRLDSI